MVSQMPGSREFPVSQTPGIGFFECLLFCSNFNPLSQHLKQQSIKKQCESLSNFTNILDSCFKKFQMFMSRVPVQVLQRENTRVGVHNALLGGEENY